MISFFISEWGCFDKTKVWINTIIVTETIKHYVSYDPRKKHIESCISEKDRVNEFKWTEI